MTINTSIIFIALYYGLTGGKDGRKIYLLKNINEKYPTANFIFYWEINNSISFFQRKLTKKHKKDIWERSTFSELINTFISQTIYIQLTGPCLGLDDSCSNWHVGR